jgi:hypothetical protein
MKMRPANWRRRLPPPTHRSVTARVIRAAVLAIGNSIAIAVAIHTIRHTIAIMIANTTMFATIPVRNLVSNASGQQTAGDDHQQRKLLHVFSSTQRPNARRTEPITIDCNPCMPNLSCPASGFRRPCSEAPIGLATGHISRGSGCSALWFAGKHCLYRANPFGRMCASAHSGSSVSAARDSRMSAWRAAETSLPDLLKDFEAMRTALERLFGVGVDIQARVSDGSLPPAPTFAQETGIPVLTPGPTPAPPHSTVTLFARLRGLSTSVPFTSAT